MPNLCFVCVKIFENSCDKTTTIQFYFLSGNKHVVCENFRIAANGQLIHYIAEETVKVWDLHLEENMTVISQNGLRMLDVGIVNETTMITTSIDANLRIWNCARKFQEPETKVSFEQIRHGSVQ